MIDRFSQRLLDWFDRHGRKDLPWQKDISPYRVWVSEIMLQQTQVTTVIPYYARFMNRFPTVESLADASEDEVLHYWTSLGYYARARNLHKAARAVVADHDGEFPSTVEKLTALPGIGRSTAGAIAAIAFGRHASILDGNAKRVLARVLAIDGWPGETGTANALWEKAEALTPTARVGDYTQAIMDLGATVCTRSSPRCEVCPFEADCIARRTDDIARFPGRKPKKELPVRSTCMLIFENEAGELLLERRPNEGLWGGLWSFPECDPGEIDSTISRYVPAASLSKLATRNSQLASFRHTFTHFHLDVTPIHVTLPRQSCAVAEPAARIWYSPAAPASIGLTRPVTRIIDELR